MLMKILSIHVESRWRARKSMDEIKKGEVLDSETEFKKNKN